jgi:hypothetical protein
MYMELLSFMLIYMNRQESLFNGLVSLDDATSFILESEAGHGLMFLDWMLKGMKMREMSDWPDDESGDGSDKKKTFLGGAGPERLQAAGVESDYRTKGVLFAA